MKACGDFCEHCEGSYKEDLRRLSPSSWFGVCDSCKDKKIVYRCEMSRHFTRVLFNRIRQQVEAIKEQKRTVQKLEAKINLLETHIRITPGGEGSLEELQSFTNA